MHRLLILRVEILAWTSCWRRQTELRNGATTHLSAKKLTAYKTWPSDLALEIAMKDRKFDGYAFEILRSFGWTDCDGGLAPPKGLINV